MKQLILPWAVTFLFGCAIFAVGVILRRREKRERCNGSGAILKGDKQP